MSVNLQDGPRNERRLIEAARIQEGRGSTTELHSESGAESWSDVPADAFAGYEIVRRLDQGGQGVVFEALQKGTRRRVAIKALLRGPLAGSADRARFEREVQILGQLRHPNIVTIHHAGQIHGSAYLVMDYIPGKGLGEYTAIRSIPVGDVLRVFLKICRGVQAAHLCGVIHRDLKPSNIRIDDAGEPHILDFGLAKTSKTYSEAGADGATEGVTMTGQFLGTLPWASPEQIDAGSEKLDLRTDIYALGLILFYLFTGRHPYPVAGRMHDVAKYILESPPIRLRQLRRDVDEDVETIIRKCLAKEPERRYQSVGGVIEDIDRYLDHRPILAHSPSTMYQLRKLVKRHKLSFVLATSLLFSSLTLTVVISILYANAHESQAVAEQQRLQAEQKAATAKAVTDFLIHDLLAAAQPSIARGKKITAEEAFEIACDRVCTAFEDQAEIRGSLLATIGNIYRDLGRHREAVSLLEESALLKAQVLGDDDVDTLQTRVLAADSLIHLGQYERAVSIAEPAYQALLRVAGADDVVTLRGASVIAQALWLQGRLPEALELQRLIHERRTKSLGENNEETAMALMQRALNEYYHVGKYEEAEAMLRSAAAVGEDTLGIDHPVTLRAKTNLALSLLEQREIEEAEALLVEGVEYSRRVFGDEHPETLTNLVHLAVLRKKQSRFSEAEQLCAEAARAAEKTLGVEYPLTLWARYELAYILFSQGHFEDALAIQSLILELRRRQTKPDDRTLASAWDGVGLTLFKLGRFGESAEAHREALEAYRRVSGTVPSPVWTLRCLVLALGSDGREEEARPIALELLELRRQAAKAPNASAYALNCYARELLDVVPIDLRDPALAIEFALRGFADSTDAYHYNRFILARAYEANGRFEDALSTIRLALEHLPAEATQQRQEYEEALLRMERAASPIVDTTAPSRDINP